MTQMPSREEQEVTDRADRMRRRLAQLLKNMPEGEDGNCTTGPLGWTTEELLVPNLGWEPLNEQAADHPSFDNPRDIFAASDRLPMKCPYCGGNEAKCDFSFTTEGCSQMNAMAPCPPDSPLMKAWEGHKASEQYANIYKWATRYIPPDDPEEIERIRQSGANAWTYEMKLQAVEGSLWASFSAAWAAAGGADPFKAAPTIAELQALL